MTDEDPALLALVRRRWRVATTLTTLMLVGYFGFITLVAWAKPFMGRLVAGGRVSIGVLIGAGVIVLAATLTGIYARWANRHYDPALQALRDR